MSSGLVSERDYCGLGFLRRKILAFCLCKIFELLFRHGLSHLFRRAFQAGLLAFPPRLAASAAPAAICCFFDLAGILFNRRAGKKRIYLFDSKQTLLVGSPANGKPFTCNHLWNRYNLRFTSRLILTLSSNSLS